MRIEHGRIPEEPGMKVEYSIIPEHMKMNPKCPCPTRTCPNHGFCMQCKEHHEEIMRILAKEGKVGDTVYCRRKFDK